MIARLWMTETKEEDSQGFFEYLTRTGVADITATPVNQGVFVLRKPGDRTEFIVLSLWESESDMEGFAGPDIERTRDYPEDERFLLEMPETLSHYEVLTSPTSDDGTVMSDG